MLRSNLIYATTERLAQACFDDLVAGLEGVEDVHTKEDTAEGLLEESFDHG